MEDVVIVLISIHVSNSCFRNHSYSYYRSRLPGSSFPADPSKFLSLSSSRVRLVFLTFVSRLTYECPVVMARPIPSAAARELHENRAEKVSPVYVNVTGQNPPSVRGSTTSERERETRTCEQTGSTPSVRNNRCSARRE